ncbi:MAG TPA: ATP-grasp domain-containing protein [Limnobacter sp.]|nr:ATP-grasp domain-containing protein [Limnobacter sp.]
MLLVDTNFSAGPLHAALQAQGHDVHLCGGNPNDALAKSMPKHHAVNYANAQSLAQLAEELEIDHVVPGCNDRAYLSCAQAKAATGHPRYDGVDSLAQTLQINDKKLFRQCARQLDLSSPKLHKAKDPVPRAPVIVKPVDAFSGQGITVLREPTATRIEHALQTARACSTTGQALVEDWIEGQLYSHSAFLREQRIVQAHVVIEHCVAHPHAVDTSHLAPADIPPAALARLELELERLAQHLQLGDGLLHTQFMWDGARCWLIELTRRCPGDLYSQLIELSVGEGYVAQYLAPHLNMPVHTTPTNRPARHILRHTLTVPQATSLHHLRFEVPLQIERWVPVASTGDALGPAPKGRIAVLFAQANNHDELKHLALRAISRTLFSINTP